jgi:hypothetical protein
MYGIAAGAFAGGCGADFVVHPPNNTSAIGDNQIKMNLQPTLRAKYPLERHSNLVINCIWLHYAPLKGIATVKNDTKDSRY